MNRELEKMSEALEKKDFSPLQYVSSVFGLDVFEQYCLASGLKAFEEDRLITPAVLIQEFQEQEEALEELSFISYFWKENPLMQYFFLNTVREGKKGLLLDERIAVFLQGNISGYIPYDFLWERIDPEEEKETLLGKSPVPLMERFLQKQETDTNIYFHLYGNKGIGKKSRIREFCRKQKRALIIIDGRILEEENQELLSDVLRECRLYGAFLLIQNLSLDWFGKGLYQKRVFQRILKEAEILFTVGEEAVYTEAYLQEAAFLEIELPMPGFKESCDYWEMELAKKNALVLKPEEWANKFLFTPGQIREAVSLAEAYAFKGNRESLTKEDLQRGCYHMLREGMGKKAVRIEASYTWEELVLPTYQKQKIMDACNQAANHKWVYETWGFNKKISYGTGISIVFAGPPGTGKTMAAQVMASQLCLDLYRIELSAVVSKYVGQTEKNLEEIFEQAKKSQVILFFDEADVLFSKRTEVKDSNDKYSNMEAAYLLQKMEEYQGITVLATNFLQNFDEAFKRRMKFIVDFPFPDAEQRYRIWKQAFPKETPVEGEIDYEFLAGSFELSGSNIKNVALHAAFLAAAEKKQVSMKHIAEGLKNEISKSGKVFSKEQMGQYYMLLSET